MSVNDAPLLDLDEDDSVTAGVDFKTRFTEGSGPVAIVDTDGTLFDVEDVIDNVTVQLTNSPDGADEFLAAETTGTTLTANFDSVTNTLLIQGVGTVADFEQVLNSVVLTTFRKILTRSIALSNLLPTMATGALRRRQRL